MPQIAAFVPLIAAVAGPLMQKFLGPSTSSSSGGGGGGGGTAQAKPKTLFTPEQISKATDTYRNEGTAKWNQIMANMGAGGGTGGVDIGGSIGSQADTLAKALGKLTDQSGYGTDPMANLAGILKGVEGGIGAKYPVY